MMSTAVIDFVGICGGFTAICVAGGWLFKIYKAVKKPVDDVEKKLSRDYKKIYELEREMEDLKKQMDELVSLSKGLVKGMWNILEHLETDNNTGGMKQCKQELLDLIQQ